jgi:predicted nucleic acid-binding protein
MTTWFADTFYFLALANPNDPAHSQSRELATKIPGSLITTAWVVTELADALSAPINCPAFLRLWRRLRANPAVEIIPPDPALFERGIALFERRPDKEWSLTDCISIVVMTERGLGEALTGDHHFEPAGFRALLRGGRS